MKTKVVFIIFVVLIVFSAVLVEFSKLLAREGNRSFEAEYIVLYQPTSDFFERISGVEELANYTKRLLGVCENFFTTADTPETLHIVVAIIPGRQSRIWFVSSTPLPAVREREPLRRQLEAVTPIEVAHGPIAYAISAKIAGGDAKSDQSGYHFPIPKEWQDAAKGSQEELVTPDGILALVWPESVSASSQRALAPTEFVTQVLEPTGGEILRPKEWFYSEEHLGPTYMWTLSVEDTSEGQAYITGVRIQAFVGVKAGTGKSAREFIIDFIATKKKEAEKVIKTCNEKDQGLFTCVCLETEEGLYHIRYSLFWGTDDLDIAIVSIAGTTKELWDRYSPIFEKMSEFKLIDMKRFEE